MKKTSLFLNLIASLFLTLVTLLPSISHAQQSIFDTSNSSLFSNDDEFLKVDQAFSFNFDQQNDQLHITFNISEGYYLYRHQFKFTANNATYTTIDLPIGLDHEDEFFGIQQIYKEQLKFTLNIEQANENSSITIRYQGCAEKGL